MRLILSKLKQFPLVASRLTRVRSSINAIQVSSLRRDEFKLERDDATLYCQSREALATETKAEHTSSSPTAARLEGYSMNPSDK